MNVIGYVLVNLYGELLTIPRTLEYEVALDLKRAGWDVYANVYRQ